MDWACRRTRSDSQRGGAETRPQAGPASVSSARSYAHATRKVRAGAGTLNRALTIGRRLLRNGESPRHCEEAGTADEAIQTASQHRLRRRLDYFVAIAVRRTASLRSPMAPRND